MWLLDVNMPRQLKPLLAELGITAETANARGWGTLVNGDLLEAAATAGLQVPAYPGPAVWRIRI